MGVINDIYAANGEQLSFTGITVGTVVSVNDPQQLGRVRAICPLLGDRHDMIINDIPWAQYGSPLIGNTYQGTRGPAEDDTLGGVTYGMWSIPKPGAQVLIMCIDGDTNLRVWMGCLPAIKTANTMPHGRYTYQTTPDGPLSTRELPIEPLYTNQTTAFGTRKGNYEWKTRGADYNASALDSVILDQSFSTLADDKDVAFTRDDGSIDFTSRQGYHKSRISPELTYAETLGGNYESSIFSWTTSGFHSISMDDRIENCRVKFRTSAGHQILMDDTNERIYINTANGANWIQLDEDGNIDIFSNKKVSIRGTDDINITAENTLRLYGKNGVHIRSDQGELRMYSKLDLNIYTDAEMKLYSSDVMNVRTGADMLLTASPNIHLNGPAAATATVAYHTNRVPQHEPWGRTNTLNDNTHAPKYSYNDPNVGKEEGKKRGQYWHR